jgi:hypothetical protein
MNYEPDMRLHWCVHSQKVMHFTLYGFIVHMRILRFVIENQLHNTQDFNMIKYFWTFVCGLETPTSQLASKRHFTELLHPFCYFLTGIVYISVKNYIILIEPIKIKSHILFHIKIRICGRIPHIHFAVPSTCMKIFTFRNTQPQKLSYCTYGITITQYAKGVFGTQWNSKKLE